RPPAARWHACLHRRGCCGRPKWPRRLPPRYVGRTPVGTLVDPRVGRAHRRHLRRLLRACRGDRAGRAHRRGTHMKLVLFTGGARSGKSTRAEQYASRLDGSVLYLATAEAHDDEMRARIAAHRARRPASWTTREEPLKVAAALAALPL